MGMVLPLLNKEDIKQLLPHRDPIIMVDALHVFELDFVVAGLTISNENIFVKDSIFSETGLIEHMAQTAALYMGYHSFLKKSLPKEGYIASIKNLHIDVLPKVNDSLVTEMTSVYTNSNMSMVKLETKLQGKTIAFSEMNMVINTLKE